MLISASIAIVISMLAIAAPLRTVPASPEEDLMPYRPLYPALQSCISDIGDDVSSIPDERRKILEDIASWIAERQAAGEAANMIFICTHNSRRSHMSQIWAQTFAWMHGLDHVCTYSGGTEATAFNPRAVKALRDCGFRITVEREGDNPLYHVAFSEHANPVSAFSKPYGDDANPQDNFSAIMTCSDADEACPVVLGAAARFATPYRDPKESDGSEYEVETYAERGRQIGAEMLYMIRHAADLTR